VYQLKHILEWNRGLPPATPLPNAAKANHHTDERGVVLLTPGQDLQDLFDHANRERGLSPITPA